MTTKSAWQVCFLKLRLDGKPEGKPADYWTLLYVTQASLGMSVNPESQANPALHPELMETTQSSTFCSHLEPSLHSIIPPDLEITLSIHLPLLLKAHFCFGMPSFVNGNVMSLMT